MLRLDYAKPNYKIIDSDCPFSFEMNGNATMIKKKGCGLNINYPNMKATLYLTYQAVKNNNLDPLLRDAQKLACDHTIKANSIPEQPYVNPHKNEYEMISTINGNDANATEVYATDT